MIHIKDNLARTGTYCMLPLHDGHKSLDSYLILNKAVCRSLGAEILIRVFAPDSFLSAVVACRSHLQSVPCLRFDPPLCRGCVCLRADVPKGIIRIVYWDYQCTGFPDGNKRSQCIETGSCSLVSAGLSRMEAGCQCEEAWEWFEMVDPEWPIFPAKESSRWEDPVRRPDDPKEPSCSEGDLNGVKQGEEKSWAPSTSEAGGRW